MGEFRAKPRDIEGIMIEQKDKRKVLRKIKTKHSDLTHIIMCYLKYKILKKNSSGQEGS